MNIQFIWANLFVVTQDETFLDKLLRAFFNSGSLILLNPDQGIISELIVTLREIFVSSFW